MMLLSLLLPIIANASVWTATQQWSPTSEADYQNWVRTSWNKDVFDQPGPLQGVKLDCADAVYSMRLLYSYQNHLPFAVKDPSSGSRIVSNDMKRFDSVPDGDRRFRAFALYLYDLLDTPSLPENSYPVAMNRDGVHSGIFLKTDHATHHSWTVHDIDRVGVPYLLFSSRPARTTLIERHGYPSMGFLWGANDKDGNPIGGNLQINGEPKDGVGFRMFRYAEDLLKPEWQVPGYSLDQFQFAKKEWSRRMQHALQLQQETPEELTSRLLVDTCKEASERIASVQLALKAQTPACFSAAQYDDLSTPSKDSRALSVFQDLVNSARNSASLSPDTRSKLEAIVAGNDSGSYCSLKIGGGTTLSLGRAISMALKHRWSSNPNDSLRARWGLEGTSSKAQSCPTY